ncbi:oxidoreductase [Aliifodinibius sp. S!AR15-10]|uniref:oxidoreductase n=1 Tax=Aliifodinibius sp. S!AR15-10 TaxID=2950437 RepID=UPI0028703B51|nr:oxidoreductase [Aliifodinibius sp. S!AR15-10]
MKLSPDKPILMKTANTILITGASSGMGKTTALQLIDQGHMVYGAARRVEKMQELEEAGGRAIEMDITDEEQIVAAVTHILEEQDQIDVLVNNAGFGLYGAVEDISIEDAKRQFEVNLFGLARITKEVLPHMRERNSGTIINISSMGGKIYTPLGAWYHASKHALEGWSDCLRLELKQFNIDVVIVEPGVIATDFGDTLSGPLLENSGDGPYEQMARAMAQATKDSYEKEGASSPPSVVADTILKVIRSDKPKTRYPVGNMARLLMFIRKYLGDRIFDKAIMSQL